jgi:hypothetical protein
LNTDLSVAPELAQLADPFVPPQHVTAAPRTDGRTAAALTELAATPQRWWDLVRFDPDGQVRINVPGEPGTWLLVLPPGSVADCDCGLATLLAGDAAEVSAQGGHGPARPLRSGRVQVRGTRSRHQLRAAGQGYSVTLHWRDSRPRSL